MSNTYPHCFRSDDDNEYLRSVEDEEIPFDKGYCQNCQQAPCQCDWDAQHPRERTKELWQRRAERPHGMWTGKSVQAMLPDVKVYHRETRQTIRGRVARLNDQTACVYFQGTSITAAYIVARIDVSWSQIALALNNATPLTA